MNLTVKERDKCGSIIHTASGAAALVGCGMAKIPLSDAVLIAPIQIKMLTSLGAVFDIELTESAAKGLFASLSASCVGRATSQLLVGWVPILGNIINASTAAGLTQAMGWLAVKHFHEERAKRSFGEAILREMPSDSEWDEIFSEGKKKWNRFWRKAKKFCEERLENLEERFGYVCHH